MNSKKIFEKEIVVVDDASSAVSLAEAMLRKSVQTIPPLAKRPEPAKTELGSLQMMSLAEIVITEDRFRKNLGDIRALAESINSVGLVQPIVVSTERELICGYRRMMAYRELGRTEIEVRIVNFEDPVMARIEEDRSRKALTPSEMYAVTEALREKAKNDAWRRRALGGQLEKAYASGDESAQKGRADDVLARFVGISRPSLCKIREVMVAVESGEEKFSELQKELDEHGRIDRTYKKLQMLRQGAEDTVQFRLILLASDWQQFLSGDVPLATALKELRLDRFASAESVFVLQSSIKSAAAAADVLRRCGFTWRETCMSEQGHLWLLGGKAGTANEQLSAHVKWLSGKGEADGLKIGTEMESVLSVSVAELLGERHRMAA